MTVRDEPHECKSEEDYVRLHQLLQAHDRPTENGSEVSRLRLATLLTQDR